MKFRKNALVACTALAAISFWAAANPAAAADLSERMGTSSPWQIRVRALGVIPEDKGTITQIPGANLSYSNSVVPELDISYFFTDNIAAELILGTTNAKIYGAPGLGQVGETWILPPTLTLQYHFTNLGAFKPYVGAGLNYTVFYSQKGVGALTDIDVKDTFGFAAQVGFDYMFDEHWGVNFDVKKLFLEPKWTGNGGALSGKAKLNPWLIGAGFTYKF